MHEKPPKPKGYNSTRTDGTGKYPSKLSGTRNKASSAIRSGDAENLQHYISEFVEYGVLFSITCTSDGGAVSIAIINGPHKRKWYARDTSEFEEAIYAAHVWVTGEE